MSSFHAFPPIADRNALPRDVLVLVVHPDDEVIGIGGLLAFHGARGDSVTVVHATGGGEGDPDGKHEDIEAIRQREVRAALAELGIEAPSSLGLPDGGLSERGEELRDAVRQSFVEARPELVYTFFPGEYHADHRALARACCTRPRPCRRIVASCSLA